MTVPRRAVGLVAAALLGLTPALVGAPATATTAQQQPTARASGRVTLKLTQVSPAAVTAKGRLTVSGTVGNGTGRKLKGARVVLTVHRDRLGSRDDVKAWQDGDPDTLSDPAAGAVKVAKVSAGGSGRFTLRVPTTQLGLADAAWAFGPRGITVQVQDARQRVVAAQRTMIVWTPVRGYQPTALSLLTPITAGRAADSGTPDAGTPDASVESELAPGGRLDRVVAATQDPSIGWAVDPAVLAAADALATGSTAGNGAPSTPTASGTPTASASAGAGGSGGSETGAMKAGRQWLVRFGAGVDRRDVVELPYADPDLSSVLNNKGLALLRMSQRLGRRVTERVTGRSFDTRVAWPGDGRAAAASVSPLVRSGHTAVVISSSTQEVPGSQVTPTGRSTLTGGDRTIDGLLYDNDLSALVAAGGTGNPVLATQELLGRLAAVTLEQPETSRQLLAVTPRSWDPNPAGFGVLVAALKAAPWVQLKPLRSLRALPAVTGRVEPTYPDKAKAAELPLGTVDRALVLRRRVEAFGPALPAGQADTVLDPYRAQIASLLSVAWRADRSNLAGAGTEVERLTDRLTDGVRLNVGGTKLFTAQKSSIQLGLQNQTDHDLSLVVDVKAGSGQLIVHSVKVTAQANKRTSVQVPSRSVANGNVTVTAVLRNPDGGAVDVPRRFEVRVRPSWERKAVIGAGSVLGLMLVIGLLRGVRRSRDRVPPTPVPDVDDLAVQHRRAAEKAEARAAAAREAQEKAAGEARGKAAQKAPQSAPENLQEREAAR